MPDTPDTPDKYADDRPVMDESDEIWVNSFIGDGPGMIPEGSVIEGFISIVSWLTPEGEWKWRSYNVMDTRLSNILGLLDMTKFTMMRGNEQPLKQEDDD